MLPFIKHALDLNPPDFRDRLRFFLNEYSMVLFSIFFLIFDDDDIVVGILAPL